MAGTARDVGARLKADLAGLRLDGPGRRGRLADDVARAVAQVVLIRTAVEQREPSGNPLAPLSEFWLAEKARLGYPSTILVMTAEMLAEDELVGDVQATADEMVMTYGTNDWTRQKAEWAHEGAENRPARPFYALGDGDAAWHVQIDAAAHAGLDAQARQLWG